MKTSCVMCNKQFEGHMGIGGITKCCSKECRDKYLKLARTTGNSFSRRKPINTKSTNLWMHYRITIKDWKDMFNKQHGKCKICKKDFGFIDDAITNRHIHVDHNHNTKQVRGLLCNKCNHLLGKCNEDINVLNSAIEYINKSNI